MRKYLPIIICLVQAFTANAQTKPNIIYILADDFGYGDASCLNPKSKLQTVNIDKMASAGMKVTDAHSNSSVCTPTRYGVLTGRYTWRTRLQRGVFMGYESILIDKERSTVASLAKKQGYQTACIGKWHLGLDWQRKADQKTIDFTQPVIRGVEQAGFDYSFLIPASLDLAPYVYLENGKATATSIDSIQATTGQGFWRAGPIGNDFIHTEALGKITEKATTFISQQAKSGKPFFLYFPLTSPHTPILPTKEYQGKSGTNAYGDFVLMTDDMVGKILQAVKNAGIEKNTIIVFTSDNGCSPQANFKALQALGHNPSYQFRGMKSDIFEGGHRVPFIIQWPAAIKPGTETKATVCLTDLMATVADILKVPLQDHEAEDSYSMLPLLLQQNGHTRQSIIHHSIEGIFSIREGKWKLILSAGSGGWSEPTENQTKKQNLPSVQLYDLETDIAETTNLAGQHPDIVKKLSTLLDEIVANGRSTKGKKQNNDVPVKYVKN